MKLQFLAFDPEMENVHKNAQAKRREIGQKNHEKCWKSPKVF